MRAGADPERDGLGQNGLCARRSLQDWNSQSTGDGNDGRRLGIASAENNCKKIVTTYIMRNMAADEVKARDRYIDQNDAEGNEILDRLSAIRAHQ